jgi:hypothetical protein
MVPTILQSKLAFGGHQRNNLPTTNPSIAQPPLIATLGDLIGITVLVAPEHESIFAVRDDQQFDYNICAKCEDAGTFLMPTGEVYRMCAPERWKSYVCSSETANYLKDASSPS